jgi:sec-independent protein translocase protein TatC
MTLLDHLSELRVRLMWSVGSIVAAAILVFTFNGPIFDVLSDPYCAFQTELAAERAAAGEEVSGPTTVEDCQFLVREPLEPFNVLLTMAGYGGLILALPMVLYQLGRFVLPGLYPHERKILLPFLAAAVALLALGIGTAYVMLPRALLVLNSLGDETFTPLFSPASYLSFLVKMTFAFGIAAELPLVLVSLQKIGIVSPEMLAKNRRIAIVAVVILGAVITPTGDPFTLAVVSVPMYLFYEISILIGRRLKPILGEPLPA